MNKEKYIYRIKKLFNLPENAKFILFRNLNEFNYFEIEKINPNHRLILWGQLKKKHRYCKNAYKIMCGKIRIPLFLMLDFIGLYYLLNINLELVLTYSILSPIIVYYMFVYPLIKVKKYTIFTNFYLIKENKDVDRNTRRIGNRQNPVINSILT